MVLPLETGLELAGGGTAVTLALAWAFDKVSKPRHTSPKRNYRGFLPPTDSAEPPHDSTSGETRRSNASK